jgi:choline dehydrogenase-like flavoprotein
LPLSGIGLQALLTDLGIPTTHVAEGVGQNMQEHLCYTHYYKSKVPTLNIMVNVGAGQIVPRESHGFLLVMFEFRSR